MPIQPILFTALTSTLPLADHDIAQLMHEHQVLLRQHAEVQTRCSALLRMQAAEIELLHTRTMRLHAQVIVRDTALAWEREDLADSAVPAAGALASQRTTPSQLRQVVLQGRDNDVDDLPNLEASLVAADLVICQTGCLSHGAYWRVQDHCARTGKACVLVAQPETLRIVRIHNSDASTDSASARPAALAAALQMGAAL